MATESAITNWMAHPGVVDVPSNPDAIDKAMDAWIMRADTLKPELGQFFERRKPVTDSLKITTLGSELELPKLSSDTAALSGNTVEPTQGYDITFTTRNFYSILEITDDMLKMDLSGKISGMMQGMPNSYRRLYEYAYVYSLIDNAFANVVGADGCYLCSDSHPNELSRHSGWDNLEAASAFSDTTWATCRVNMMTRKGRLGDPDPRLPKTLIHPPALTQTVFRVLRSPLLPGYALNDANWNQDSVTPMPSHWMTSTTAWLALDGSTGDERGLYLVERQAPEITQFKRENPYIKKSWAGKAAFVTGFSICRGIHGSVGA